MLPQKGTRDYTHARAAQACRFPRRCVRRKAPGVARTPGLLTQFFCLLDASARHPLQGGVRPGTFPAPSACDFRTQYRIVSSCSSRGGARRRSRRAGPAMRRRLRGVARDAHIRDPMSKRLLLMWFPRSRPSFPPPPFLPPRPLVFFILTKAGRSLPGHPPRRKARHHDITSS